MHVIVDNSAGGDARFADDVASALRAHGLEVEVRAPGPAAMFDTAVHLVSTGLAIRVSDRPDRTTLREIEDVVTGKVDSQDNVLKNAPHTAAVVMATEWRHPYTREQAAFPLPFVRERKYWPPVGRIDNTYGDRNLFCSCPPVTE